MSAGLQTFEHANEKITAHIDTVAVMLQSHFNCHIEHKNVHIFQKTCYFIGAIALCEEISKFLTLTVFFFFN